MNDFSSDEQERLGSYSPIKTLMQQSFGPVISQIATATYGIVDSYWISKALGDNALAALGSVSIYELINLGFAQYFNSCASARLGYLYGQKKNDVCAQVAIDLIKLAIPFSIILPIILLSTIKPFTLWLGSSSEIAQMSFDYLLPISSGCCVLNWYYIICGVLQAEGRSALFGMCQAASLLLNMIALDPLFLLYFRTGIWGATVASLLANLIPLIGLLIPLFMGKFSIQPKFSMFYNEIHPESYKALKVGLSTLIAILSITFPSFIFFKYLGIRAIESKMYDEAFASMNIVLKVYSFVICIDTGLTQGLLPTASYAYGAERLYRFKWLFIHCLWIGSSWNGIASILCVLFSKNICSIWLSNALTIEWAAKFLRIGVCTLVLFHSQYATSVALQSAKKLKHSAIFSVITQLITVPFFATLIFYFDQSKKAMNLMFAYIMNDVFSFILTIFYIIYPLRTIITSEKSETIIDSTNQDIEELD